MSGVERPRLGWFWRPRYWAFRVLMVLAMRALPASRYKRELSSMLWTLSLRVQAHDVALKAAHEGVADAV